MCDPLSITMGVMSTLSAVAGHQQQSVAAKMQTKQHEQNQRNAHAALRDSYIAIQNRQQQEAQSAAQQIEERRRESVRQMSSAYAAAGEAGVSGFSVQSILAELPLQPATSAPSSRTAIGRSTSSTPRWPVPVTRPWAR